MIKKLLMITIVMILLLVGCKGSSELSPQKVTDSFLSELFKVEDYKVVNASKEEDIMLIDILKLAHLEPYATIQVLKNIMANRTSYTIEAEAERLNGKGKWMPIQSEVRNQTEEACTVWYTGEYVIVVEGSEDIKYPISGTAYLKHNEAGWVIHGNTFIGFPLWPLW